MHQAAHSPDRGTASAAAQRWRNATYGSPRMTPRFGFRQATLVGYATMASSADYVVGPLRRGDLLPARQFPVARASDWLVTRVVPVAELETYILDYAARIAENAPLTLGAVKRALPQPKAFRRAGSRPVQRMVYACYASEDYRKGRPRSWERNRIQGA